MRTATQPPHDFDATRAPLPAKIIDPKADATGPAIFALRSCPANLQAVRAILDTVPQHIRPLVAEAASNRNIVPKEVVVIVLQEIGYPALAEHLGTDIAANVINRYLPAK